jgi:hypothetical protein
MGHLDFRSFLKVLLRDPREATEEGGHSVFPRVLLGQFEGFNWGLLVYGVTKWA